MRPAILDRPLSPFQGSIRLVLKLEKKFYVTMNKMINVSFISFLVFGYFWQQIYENIKILRNLSLHFARQDGQDGKENHATKVTQNTKRQKYGMTET